MTEGDGADMDEANPKFQRNSAERRKQSPLAWVIGCIFVAFLVGLLVFYYGFTDRFNQATGSDGSTRPNMTTETTK